MTKEEWKEELDGVYCHLEKEGNDIVNIKIKDIPELAYTSLMNKAMVKNLTEKHGSDWCLRLNCWYDTNTGSIEYEGEVAKGTLMYVNLEIEEELKKALDETIKLFWRKQVKLWKAIL